jgi:flagellar M-ring protein FliF
LPRGGGIGFELFDKQSFGTTSFVEQMNYRRALQGELARTIMSLDEVERARVHVAVPERTLYKDDDEAPSASVMLQLKAGRKLGSAQVRGVVNLVAASVAGLKPERITVVDEAGTPLWAGDDASGGLEAASEIERSLQRRVRDLVERVVGPGHAQVAVTAELDESRSERTEDVYDKDKTALRSESKTEDRSDGNAATGGVAGARGNLPGAAAPTTGAGESGRVRLSETKNYEVDHVVSHTVQPKTRIKRLHVAVLVDHAVDKKGKSAPRSAEELQRITSLARAAAGLDDERGDKIEVATAPFVAAAPEAAAGPEPTRIPKWAPFAGGGIAVLLMIIAAASIARRRRPLVGELVPALPAPVGQVEATLAQAGAGAALPSGAAGALPTASARDRALTAAREDSGRAARILAAWLAEEQAKGGTPS